MTTMRCEDVLDRMPALARGELRDDDAAAVRAHIATCDDCADAWAIVDALAAARPAAPAHLADRVSAAVARRHAVGPRRRAGRWLAGAGLAAAAVLALVVAWPDGAVDDARTIALAPEQFVETDPFLEAGLFGATTPTEAELDGMIRVAALSDGDALPAATLPEIDENVPGLAADVGPALGDWPGADGMSAGMMLVDELSYDEMQMLLQEMTT